MSHIEISIFLIKKIAVTEGFYHNYYSDHPSRYFVTSVTEGFIIIIILIILAVTL